MNVRLLLLGSMFLLMYVRYVVDRDDVIQVVGFVVVAVVVMYMLMRFSLFPYKGQT